MIVIASVQMKPLRRNLTMAKPLMRPTAAPTASSTRMPGTQPQSVPAPKAATGTISHAEIIGASPKVDSSDRSMPPIMMIRDSPMTTIPSADACWPTPARFPTEKKYGLASEPMIRSTAITGRSAAPRTNATAATRRVRFSSRMSSLVVAGSGSRTSVINLSPRQLGLR
jgi:hypothetical protein